MDASVRFRLGTVDVLITIEARKRGDNEDVRWIEQLASKKERLLADTTIAVSSKGFTQEAAHVAAELGIHLRTLADIGESDVLAWLGFSTLNVVGSVLTLRNLAVELWETRPDLDLTMPDSISELWQKTGRKAKIFRRADGSEYSANDCINEFEQQGMLWKDIPENRPPVQRLFRREFGRGELTTETSSGTFDVKHIDLTLELSREHGSRSMKRGYAYSQTNSPLVHGAEFDVSIPGSNRTLRVHRDAESGRYYFDDQYCSVDPNNPVDVTAFYEVAYSVPLFSTETNMPLTPDPEAQTDQPE